MKNVAVALALKALICDPDKVSSERLRKAFAANQFVEKTLEARSIKESVELIGEKSRESINAIFIDPFALGLEAASKFIFHVRQKLPHIVFCLYMERSQIEKHVPAFYEGERDRFHHYYSLDKDSEEEGFAREVQNAVFLCISDVRVFSEIDRLRLQRSFYLEALPPPEISGSLHRFKQRYPDDKPVAFIIMRFGPGRLLERIHKQIKETLSQFGIIGVRADEFSFSDKLFVNVETYLHGCDFGVVVFERIENDVLSPNIALEAGYLQALRKPICILKERSIKTMPTDLLGAVYVEFDAHELKRSLKQALRQWFGRKALGGPTLGDKDNQ